MATPEYTSALQRIRKAETQADLQKLDQSLLRIYQAGFFTAAEYMRLDSKVFHKLACLDANSAPRILPAPIA